MPTRTVSTVLTGESYTLKNKDCNSKKCNASGSHGIAVVHHCTTGAWGFGWGLGRRRSACWWATCSRRRISSSHRSHSISSHRSRSIRSHGCLVWTLSTATFRKHGLVFCTCIVDLLSCIKLNRSAWSIIEIRTSIQDQPWWVRKESGTTTDSTSTFRSGGVVTPTVSIDMVEMDEKKMVRAG